MKIRIDVDGGRMGAWFKFFCCECDRRLENDDEGRLTHPAVETKGIILRRKVKIDCINAGKTVKNPFYEVEAVELTLNPQ